MGADQQGNAVLGALLGELGWSPGLLAEVVNGVLGPGYVARSTVSDWLNHDRLPRDPLPTVVAHLISDALDREVSVAQLWSGRAQPAELAQAAAGNTRGFHAAADEARALLDTPSALDTCPAHLPWFGPDALERQLAQGALTLAAVTSRDSRRLLDGAEAVLGGTATDAAMASHAVFHAACLARAHVAADDLDRAVPAGLTALRRLPTVRSRRCALLLRRLETDLAALPPTRPPAAVRSLQDQLHATHAV